MSQILKIELEVLDASMLQIAHAICKYNLKANGTNHEAHIIDVDELWKHIKAYADAEREFQTVEDFRKLNEQNSVLSPHNRT